MRWICNDCNRKFMLRARMYHCPFCDSLNVKDIRVNVKKAIVIALQTRVGMKGR